MNQFKVSFIVLAAFLPSCVQTQERRSSTEASAAAPAVEIVKDPELVRPTQGTLDVVLAERTASTPLGKQRVFEITESTPDVIVGETTRKKFPFVSFQLDQLDPGKENLIVRTEGLSLAVDRVGISFPKLYIAKDGSPVELAPISMVHRSQIGTCLIAEWTFSTKDIPKGAKVVLMNQALGFGNSLGKIEAANPNLNLQKSVGICSLVSIYPVQTAKYLISLKRTH